jgi:hypothetical protein
MLWRVNEEKEIAEAGTAQLGKVLRNELNPT